MAASVRPLSARESWEFASAFRARLGGELKEAANQGGLGDKLLCTWMPENPIQKRNPSATDSKCHFSIFSTQKLLQQKIRCRFTP